MNKYLIATLSLISLLFFACSKSGNSENGPQTTGTPQIKIQLVSGGSQTDTIGNKLANPIVVEVTKNGSPAAGYAVTFQGPGCAQGEPTSLTTQQGGLTGVNWSLTGDVGEQSVKVYVLDAGIKVDSVTVAETALAAGPGWHNGGCSVEANIPVASFCKLSTGRMFVSYDGQAYLKYSDDNGANWYIVAALGKTHKVTKTVSTPSGEVLAFTAGTDGTFYSNNGGQTWINLGVPPFNPEFITGAIYTPDSKLMVTSTDVPLSISLDKGKTWTTTPLSNFGSGPEGITYKNPCEDKNGNLYVVDDDDAAIYISSNEGKNFSWYSAKDNIGLNNDIVANRQQAFYIDNNNTFYIATKLLGIGIVASANGSVAYSQFLTTSTYAIIDDMSLQSDGRFYYEDISTGLYAANSSSSSAQLIFPFPSQNELPYIVAKNNNIIIASPNTPYLRYFTK